MKIKLELFAEVISQAIKSAINGIEINVSEEAYYLAAKIVKEIREVLVDRKIGEDYEVVEAIMEVFEKYNIDAGDRHCHF